MKNILATAIASLAFIGAAYAATVEGVVQSVDPATRTVTLEDGTSVVAAEGVAIEELAPGAKVTVTLEDGTTNATAIEAVM
jgi:translation initiation factor IF-1